VLYADQVVLHNLKTNLFLHVTEQLLPVEAPIAITNIPGISNSKITPKEPDRRDPPFNFVPRFEVNVSTTLSRFQVLPYQ